MQNLKPFLFRGRLWLILGSFYMQNQNPRQLLNQFKGGSVWLSSPLNGMSFEVSIQKDKTGNNSEIWLIQNFDADTVCKEANFFPTFKIRKIVFCKVI